ncbi:unnamed protein product, partial [Medioppia subpectinata]
MKKEALTYGENNDSRRYRRKRPKNGAPIVSVTDEHKVEGCLTLGNPVTTIAYETNTASDGIQLIQNRADLKFTRMVKMSTNINGFKELCEDDKIVLLKAGCPQLWLLQNIVDFDVDGQFWRIPIDEENATLLRMSVLEGWSNVVIQSHWNFMSGLRAECNVDMNLIDLLSSIALFNPDLPNLVHKHSIILQRKTYMYLLQRYLETKHNSKSESETRFEGLTYGEDGETTRHRQKRVKTTEPFESTTIELMPYKRKPDPMSQIPSAIRGLIFKLNELEFSRFKQLFISMAIIKDPVVKCAANETTFADIFRHLEDRNELKYRRIVKMAANITEFNDLCAEDRIALVRAGAPHIACLTNVLGFDFEGQFWTVPIDKDNAIKVPLDVLKSGKCGLYDANRQYMKNLKHEYDTDINLLDIEFGCFFGDNCDVNRLTRKFCKKCRIDKCLSIGMKREALTYGEDGETPRHRRKRVKITEPVDSTTTELMPYKRKPDLMSQIPSVIR